MNLIQFGIDVSSFSSEKKATLQEFINLFNQLEKYDGMKVNPVMGEGLVSFNNSITQTSKLLDEINSKLEVLNTKVSSSSSSSKTAATSTSALSGAQAELARINEQLQKTWDKLSVATSDEAKALAMLKVELAEANKANIEQAKSLSLATSAREAARQKAAQEKEELRQIIAAYRAEEEMQKMAEKAKRDDAKAAASLISEYAILKKSLQDQAIAYQNLYITQGRKAPATLAALDEYKATANVITGIDKQLQAASGTSKLFGGALASAFSQIRTLAYILPGIGIAGLFNLAFEAIEKAAEETGLFNNKLEQYINFQTAINKTLEETVALNNQLYDLDKKLNNENAPGVVGQERLTEKHQARGYDAVSLAQEQARNSEANVQKSSAELVAKGIAPEALSKDLERRLSVMQDYANQIKKIQDKIDEQSDPNRKAKERQEKENLPGANRLPSGGLGVVKVNSRVDPDLAKKEKEDLEARLKLEQDAYKVDSEMLSKYLADQKKYFTDAAALTKLYEDERRKKTVETTKDIISVNIDANQKILSDERSTQEERLRAVRNIANEQRKLNAINAYNVTDNISSTPVEKQLALEKQLTEDKKVNQKQREQTDKIDIDFYQRHLKATTEISKDEVEKNALNNEKVFRNDEKTIEERLEAYTKYIIEKQHLQDLELQKDLQRGAKEAGGKTSLTKDEETALKATSLKQQVSIQADAEKQIYDIVYTSTQKQLKEIINFNKLTESDRKKSYTDELHDLNDQFENHKINYESYRKKRLEIDRKYALIELDNNIKDDETEIKRLQDFAIKERKLRDEANDKVDVAQAFYDSTPDGTPEKLDAKRNLDTLIGQRNAYNSTIKDSDKALKDAQDKLSADELAREKAKFDLLQQYNKNYAQTRQQIEEGLFNLVKTALDGEMEKRIRLFELNKQIIDEEYTKEISGVEQSSLSAKNKEALEVQLNAEKQARDKDAAFQERELKRQQAVTDRELTLAHIAWNTEEAISKTYATFGFAVGTPLALAQAALGAIEAATVLATPIPYAKGTPVGGHQHPERLTLTGEAGTEIIKEPYKSPYFVTTPTVSYLPKGTEVIPIKDIDLEPKQKDDSWEQTRFLAKQISKNKQEIKNIFKPNINIDLNFEIYKSKILGR